MRRSRLLLILTILLTAFKPGKPYLTKWVISNNCFLTVAGSTNVNKFNCIIADYHKPDTLTFYKGAVNEPVKMAGSMALDVQYFDCHNPMMTGDLRKTLKWKEYPRLIIRFVNLSRYPETNKADHVKGAVTIELAGVVRQYEVDYRILPEGTKCLSLLGTRQVKFSDFNLVPPRRLGGMIQTNNELSVEFSLKVKILE